jgi:hypothetical protein
MFVVCRSRNPYSIHYMLHAHVHVHVHAHAHVHVDRVGVGVVVCFGVRLGPGRLDDRWIACPRSRCRDSPLLPCSETPR